MLFRSRVGRLAVLSVVANRAPVVSVNPTSLTVDSGEDFRITGYDTDADGVVVSRAWTLAGATIGTDLLLGARAPVFAADTVLTYAYTVTDNQGASTTATASVTVRRAPLAFRQPDGSLVGRVLRTFTASEVTALNTAGA